MELDPAAGPLDPPQAPLRSLQAFLREALLVGHAEGGQDAVGQEHQPPARAQQPGRLGHPAVGIAPDAGPVLADDQVEAPTGEWHPLGVGLDQGERQPEPLLAAGRGRQLGRIEVDPDRAGTLPCELGRQVGGTAAQLGHVQAPDGAEDAEDAFGDLEQAPGELGGGPGAIGVLVGELGVHHRPEGAIPGEVRPGVRQRCSELG
jgi:hypothetical protein